MKIDIGDLNDVICAPLSYRILSFVMLTLSLKKFRVAEGRGRIAEVIAEHKIWVSTTMETYHESHKSRKVSRKVAEGHVW